VSATTAFSASASSVASSFPLNVSQTNNVHLPSQSNTFQWMYPQVAVHVQFQWNTLTLTGSHRVMDRCHQRTYHHNLLSPLSLSTLHLLHSSSAKSQGISVSVLDAATSISKAGFPQMTCASNTKSGGSIFHLGHKFLREGLRMYTTISTHNVFGYVAVGSYHHAFKYHPNSFLVLATRTTLCTFSD